MFGMGIWELLVILAIVVVIFGAGKLPELGAGLGKGIKNFKDATKKEEHYILPIPILSKTCFNFLDATSFVLASPLSKTSLIKLLLIISLY